MKSLKIVSALVLGVFVLGTTLYAQGIDTRTNKPVMGPLRAGASDEQLKEFFLNVVERKPREHDFRNNYVPNRKMIAIGG